MIDERSTDTAFSLSNADYDNNLTLHNEASNVDMLPWSNFTLLEFCCPELFKKGRYAERYIIDDPNSCIYNISSFIERLTSIILEENGDVDFAAQAQLKDKIQLLESRQLITPEIGKIMCKLRYVRNCIAHATRDFTSAECDYYIRDIYELSVWFVKVYVDENYIAGDYYPLVNHSGVSNTGTPVLSADLADELLNRIAQAPENVAVSGNIQSIPIECRIERTKEVSNSIFAFELKGKQKEILSFPFSGHAVITGVAGSGKSFCALKRAEQVVHETNGKVLLLTYNNAILNYMNALFKNPNPNIERKTYHSFVVSELRKVKIDTTNRIIANPSDLIEAAISNIRMQKGLSNILSRYPQFFENEIKWIEDFGYLHRDEYLKADRIGRGKERIRRTDRDIVYDVFEEYRKLRRKADKDFDFDDLPYYFNEAITKYNIKPSYKCIIIDEGQDFSPMMLRSISAYAGSSCSLMVFGDMAQRVYSSSRISWKNVGLKIKHVFTLNENYRNSFEIASYVDAIRKSIVCRDMEDEESVTPVRCIIHGRKPALREYSDDVHSIKGIMEAVNYCRDRGSVCIILPTYQSARWYKSKLDNDINAQIIDRRLRHIDSEHGVYLTTYQSVKGMEFDSVILAECNEASLNQNQCISGIEDEELKQSHLLRLIYVAASRARKLLIITSTGTLFSALPIDAAICDYKK